MNRPAAEVAHAIDDDADRSRATRRPLVEVDLARFGAFEALACVFTRVGEIPQRGLDGAAAPHTEGGNLTFGAQTRETGHRSTRRATEARGALCPPLRSLKIQVSEQVSISYGFGPTVVAMPVEAPWVKLPVVWTGTTFSNLDDKLLQSQRATITGRRTVWKSDPQPAYPALPQ